MSETKPFLISVRWFRARGDDIHDDIPNIRWAIRVANWLYWPLRLVRRHPVVYFPKGEYGQFHIYHWRKLDPLE